MVAITISIEGLKISRDYPENDPIWNLPEEKRARKVVADSQRDLFVAADKFAMEQITIRG